MVKKTNLLSKLKIDEFSPESLYSQLENGLRRLILDEKSHPGTKIPTAFEISRTYGISRGTVEKAMRNLTQDGLIVRRSHRGTIVAKHGQTHQRIEQERSRVIAFVSPMPKEVFYSEVAMEIELLLERRGYCMLAASMVELPGENGLNPEVLKQQKIGGAIIGYLDPDSANGKVWSKTGFPIVTWGCPGPDELDYVAVNRAKGMMEALDYLVSLGHREILFLCMSGIIGVALSKLGAFKEGLKKHRIKFSDDMVVHGVGTQLSGYEKMKDVLSWSNKPTALICHNDLVAIGAMKAVRETGLNVPGDISVVGFDDVEIASFTETPLTTVAQPKSKMARKIVEVLLERIEGRSQKPLQHIVLDSKLIIRNSCTAPCRDKAVKTVRKGE